MTDTDTNIFVLFSDSMAFNFISLIDDSYEFLYEFFQNNGFQMTTFEGGEGVEGADGIKGKDEEVLLAGTQKNYLN